MTTPAPQPSAYARERLAELTAAGYSVEVLAVTAQGTVLVLMDGEIPMFIAHDADTPRAELAGQTFIVCERAEQSFQRFLRSHVDEDFRLVWTH
jgi:hypothetical protein